MQVKIERIFSWQGSRVLKVTPRASIKTAVAAFLACALLFGNGGVYLSSATSPADPEKKELVFPKSFNRHLQAYAAALSLVESGYADPADLNRAIARSIQRMLSRLDPHSSFFDPKTFGELRAYQGGNYSGIGVRVAPVDGRVMVLSTTAGSPAEKSGIRPGDVFLSVDGISTRDRPGAEVVRLLRGARDTRVDVLIERSGVDRPLGLQVRREEIPEPSLPLCYAILPGVVYLQLAGFTATTEDEVDRALKPFQPDVQGLVLDLRDNMGGNLQSAIGVADRFLDMNRVILVTKGRLPNSNARYVATRGRDGEPFPLVVLINKRTASAAEILAGAIQDARRGVVVGENSFGKGLVQTIFSLSGGNGLSLTTAKWFTPNGRTIQRNYKNRSLLEYLKLVEGLKSGRSAATPRMDSSTEEAGEGGIFPDVWAESVSMTSFQQRLLSRHLLFAFAREFKARYPVLASTAIVSPLVLEEFREFLAARGLIRSDPEFQDHLPFIQRSLRSRLLLLSLQPKESRKVELEGDLQVIQALASLPRARLLLTRDRSGGD